MSDPAPTPAPTGRPAPARREERPHMQVRKARRPARDQGHPGNRRKDSHSRSEPVLAALDLGTNNCRLLIAVPAPTGFRIIDSFSRIVRLGQGLQNSPHLSDDAMERTLQALKICARKMAKQNVTLSRVVATAACRRARNCDIFLKRAAAETDLDIEIISAREEAELALAGCLPLLDPDIPNALVFDIGGGSTELVWYHIPENGAGRDGGGKDGSGGNRTGGYRTDVMSLPFGVVSFAERHGGDRFDKAAYRRMVEEVYAALSGFEAHPDIARLVRDGTVQMLGTSGTVTTLAGIRQNLQRYERNRIDGSYLGFEEIKRISRRLAALDYRERAAIPCIGEERADLVVAGCAILQGICERWPVGRLRVADRGLREGILCDLLRRVSASG